MRSSWLNIVDSVLRPARPRLEACERERASYVAGRGARAQERRRALAECEARIHSERAAVFAAADGRVSPRMTDLEREWRTLAARDPDGGVMDLWARIAPAGWIERKPWRDSDPAAQLDAAVALAADVAGVEAVDAALVSLRAALAPFRTPIGPRTRWCVAEHETDVTHELLAEPLRAALDALDATGRRAAVLEQASAVERAVLDAARARLPRRPRLAQDLGHAAFADCVLGSIARSPEANPARALYAIWRVGYTLAAADATSVTIEIPPL